MKRRSSCLSLFAVVVGALLLCSFHARAADPSAGDRETARTLMKRGDALYDQSDYSAALEAYRAAHAIMGVPTTGLPLAHALERLGRLVEARDFALGAARFPEHADEPPPFAEARTEATAFSVALAERIPSVQIRVTGLRTGAAATVQIDGKPVPSEAMQTPWKLDPGKHTVRAQATGYVDATVGVTLGERAHETVELVLVPAAKKTDRPPPAVARGTSPLVYVGFGLGAAGVVAGSITGIVAWRKTSAIEDQCDPVCPDELREDADTADAFATVSNVAFIVAGAGVATGILGLLLTPAGAPSKVTASIGPRRVGLAGSF